jgi:hypothetical protein
MTVSGLGTAQTPRSPLTSPALRPPRVEKPAARNDFEHLTAADLELIYQVTGQRLGPRFDPAKDVANSFAAALAAERAAGRLQPGQPVTGLYLKDLNRRYQRHTGPNPVAPHLDKALTYLAASGVRRIDVSA